MSEKIYWITFKFLRVRTTFVIVVFVFVVVVVGFFSVFCLFVSLCFYYVSNRVQTRYWSNCQLIFLVDRILNYSLKRDGKFIPCCTVINTCSYQSTCMGHVSRVTDRVALCAILSESWDRSTFRWAPRIVISRTSEAHKSGLTSKTLGVNLVNTLRYLSIIFIDYHFERHMIRVNNKSSINSKKV